MAEQKFSRQEKLNRLKAERMSRNFLLVVLIAIGYLFFDMVRMFLMPVFIAAIFAGLTYSWYEKLLHWLKGRRGLSSFLCCLIMIVLITGPIAFVVDLVRAEAMDFYNNNEERVQNFISRLNSGFIADLRENKIVKSLGIDLNLENFDYASYAKDAAKGLGSFLVGLLNTTRQGFNILWQVVIMLFTMYYFYKDGHKLIAWAKYLSPLNDEHEDALIERFVSVSRATIKGTLLIGLTQGVLGALVLWISGFSSPVLWGVVMVALSIIPMVGAWGVLLPAGIFALFTGMIWQGIFIIAATVVIGNVDNFMRPRLVGRDTGMHDLVIFFSSIGGLVMFGLMGFILGPIVAVLFLTILEIYGVEFKSYLEAANLQSEIKKEKQ